MWNLIKPRPATLRLWQLALLALLFVLARVLNRMDGGDDVYWKSERLARQDATE